MGKGNNSPHMPKGLSAYFVLVQQRHTTIQNNVAQLGKLGE